jgi:hypothetical protein
MTRRLHPRAEKKRRAKKDLDRLGSYPSRRGEARPTVIRASDNELERWKRAAAAAGALSLSAFARDALDERSPEVMPIDEAPPSPLSLADDPRWARDLALIAAGGRRT